MLIGSLAILTLLIFIFLGVPLAAAMILTGILGLLALFGPEQMISGVESSLYNFIANYSFSVIPMFILMGQIAAHSGIFNDIFEVVRKWMGRIPGGLAIGVVIAQTIFAACTGSSAAACVVIGKVAIPAMRKMGYPDELSAGVVAGSGTLAALIPPSVIICIYGLIVDESIGKLLIGGVLPGLLTSVVYVAMIAFQCRHFQIGSDRFSMRDKFYSIRHLWPTFLAVVGILGGIYSGICTPTEGGAVGAGIVFLTALFTGRISWRILANSVHSTVVTTGMLLIMLVGALLFGRLLTLSGFTHTLVGWVSGTDMPRAVVFLLIAATYLFLGCFVGGIGMMVMTLPVFYPMIMKLGYDPIWFGIIVVIFCEIAMETPPIGLTLFATKSAVDDIEFSTIVRGAIPFVLRDLMVVCIIYLAPGIVLFLPGLM